MCFEWNFILDNNWKKTIIQLEYENETRKNAL